MYLCVDGPWRGAVVSSMNRDDWPIDMQEAYSLVWIVDRYNDGKFLRHQISGWYYTTGEASREEALTAIADRAMLNLRALQADCPDILEDFGGWWNWRCFWCMVHWNEETTKEWQRLAKELSIKDFVEVLEIAIEFGEKEKSTNPTCRESKYGYNLTCRPAVG